MSVYFPKGSNIAAREPKEAACKLNTCYRFPIPCSHRNNWSTLGLFNHALPLHNLWSVECRFVRKRSIGVDVEGTTSKRLKKTIKNFNYC